MIPIHVILQCVVILESHVVSGTPFDGANVRKSVLILVVRDCGGVFEFSEGAMLGQRTCGAGVLLLLSVLEGVDGLGIVIVIVIVIIGIAFLFEERE